MSQRRALIIGGSVGGLFAANLLRATGWDVCVFERSRGSLADRGAGIGTREELFTVLRRLGIKIDPTMAVEVQGRLGLDLAGAEMGKLPVRSITSAWARIWQPLRDALPPGCYQDGTALVRVEQDSRSVTAFFKNGTTAVGDLLVGADGPLSTVRSQMLPGLSPSPASYVAWRCVIEHAHLLQTLHAPILDHMVFAMPDGELMLSVPMPASQGRASGNGRRCHFIWFRPLGRSTLSDFRSDTAKAWNGTWILQKNIRPEALKSLKEDAKDRLPPQLATLFQATSQIILQPIFDLQSPRLVFGRVALLGDAAFVARPHVATGVMKAALDAERLADALTGTSGDLDDALGRYDHERRMFGDWLVARGRHIASYFETGSLGSPQERMQTLMHEYGAAGVVADEPITVRQLG